MLRRFILTSFLLTSVAHAQIPDDAKRVLDRLPGKKLSVDVVVAKAFNSSDSIRAVHAQALAIESSYWESLARTDTLVTASASYSKNENRNASVFDPRNSKLFEVGASKYFSTGTLLNLQLSELNTTLQPQNTFMPPDKAAAKVTLSQSLLKDAFGQMTRKQLQAGKLLKETSELTYRQALQDWTLGLINIYYGAWLAQAQLRAAQSDFERRERLMKVTRLKLRRGTAERPDALQVEASLLQARAALDQTTLDLQKTWRDLVSSLKLPEAWADIPAEKIPLSLDEPTARALLLCGQKSYFESSRAAALEQRLWEKRLAASEKLLAASKNSLLPELSLEGSYGSTGLVGDFSTRSENALGMNNPEWTIGIRLKMPINHYAEKAQLSRDASAHAQNVALASKAKTDHSTSWTSGCLQLSTLLDNQKLLEDAVKALTQRASLEERRFEIGRTTTFNVILAGDEKAAAELRMNQMKTAVNQAAWNVLKLNGEIENYLEGAVKSASALDLFEGKK